jgi:hypothetical protein
VICFLSGIQHLGAAYLLNASAEVLLQMYDEEEQHQAKWEDSPSEITLEDWTEYLGDSK